ncbi:hypothetical protein CkaCkLH20_02312 [Colletotrichum karsti]|uniref:TLC domain-containing protein n=1 Tax=Colletotrichum karsti TaxID=1095194 RepID=A0A9P6IAZ5_9PEZI|nr:uncharacterized protein CkaCkLH20_02312 [Colletotrichum karsti]KAF9880358.1 hypothetical protein CkaCkLH20_02312 [Colletotrichum karsti]
MDLTLPVPIYIMVGLAAYQCLNHLLRMLVRHLNPSFYASLELDKPKKLRPCLVFPLGTLLTLLISTPACLSAYTSTPPETDTFRTQRSYTTSGSICLASRGILWISEMPPLSYSSEYLTHHILALGSILIVVFRDMPRRPIYLIYAGLVTEIFKNTAATLKLHGRNATNSAVFRGALLVNVVLMVLLRIFPIVVYLANMEETSLDLVGGVAMYCAYLTHLTFLQLKTLGFVDMTIGELLHDRLFGSSVKHPAARWLPRPMTLVACGALAIATSAISEYITAIPQISAVTMEPTA